MGRFEETYNRLNRSQREAVDTIEGPLQVIAGPGTGKTELLAARVANILRVSDVYPDNILCLTFTNKAADNMQQRLEQLIGADGRRVQVKTFHSLAAEIMNRYPEHFWHGAQLSIAADAVQLEIIQTVLASLPDTHPLALKFAGQYTLISDVTRSIKLAKEAGLTPDKLRALVNTNLAYLDVVEPFMISLGSLTVSQKNIPKISLVVKKLPLSHDLAQPFSSLSSVIQTSYQQALASYQENGKTRAISQWKARWLQKIDNKHSMSNERARNEWWLAIADAYEKYRGRMRQLGHYDYADMLVETIGQIEQTAALRATLQEQFQYVLIDEFQDTNAAQLRLAHLLADHPDLDNPNIMVVGDDDQSIFKFQGAELSNMLGFNRQYKNAEVVVLDRNYRSTQTILDNAQAIIEHAEYRLVTELPALTKKLIAATETKRGKVIHQKYRSRQEQLDDIAHTAHDLLKKGSVAILARRHASLRDIAMILHTQGTPISYEQQNDVLQQPAIEQLYFILKLLVSIKKGEGSRVNELLSQTLRHPMWEIPPKTLWEFALGQQKNYDWLGGLSDNNDKDLKRIAKWLNWLTAQSSEEPLAVIVEFVLGLRDNDVMPSPIKHYFFSKPSISEQYIETLSAIQTLRGLISEFRINRAAKVEDLVRLIDLMQENGKTIADTSPFISGEKSVELLSVHKAKGLEFDAVMVIDACESEWSPSSRGRIPPANLPLRPAEDDRDDYVRLMYVAATRARYTLIFGSYLTTHKGEAVLPASSLSDIRALDMPKTTGKSLAGALERTLLWPKLEQSNEKALLQPKLSDYRLNVSNLINFLDVTKGGPRYFKERNLLRLPEAKTPAAAMGTAVHAALYEAQLQYNRQNIKLASVLDVFEEKLRDEGLPEDDYKRKLAEGKRLLTNFIKKDDWQFNKGAKPEYVINGVALNKSRLSGNLDVMYISSDATLVQDYKTGRPLASLSITSAAEGLKAWRHKQQLNFYALLIELDPAIHIKGDITCQMVYVESSKKTQRALSYQPTKNELTRLGTLIQAVWKHIMELNFPDISHYSPDLKGVKAFEEDLIGGKI